MALRVAASVGLSVGDVKKSVASITGSVSYLKTLIPIAASNIINNRVEYEPYLFETHYLKKTQYTTFSRKVPKKHDLFNVYHWLKNAVEDINKKYLKKLYIIIRDKDTKNVIEHYCFTVQYTEKDKSTMISKKWDSVLDATANIFQSIHLLSQQEKLDNRNISFAMQVILNESAPDSYTTPRFDRGVPYVDSNADDAISVGVLSTGYHKLKIYGKGNIFNTEEHTGNEIETHMENNPQPQLLNNHNNILEKPSSKDPTTKKLKITVLQNTRIEPRDSKVSDIASNNLIESENNKKRNMKSRLSLKVNNEENDNLAYVVTRSGKVVRKVDKLLENAEVQNSKEEEKEKDIEEFLQPPKKKGKATKCNDSITKDDVSKDETDKYNHNTTTNDKDTHMNKLLQDLMEPTSIKCLCGIANVIMKVELTVCDNCGKSQHCPCLGYKTTFGIPKSHICYGCHVITGRKMTDVRMYNVRNKEERQLFSMLRLISYYCVFIDNSPLFLINQIAEKNLIIEQLKKYNLIYLKNGEHLCNIDRARKVLQGSSFYRTTNAMEFDNSTIAID